MVSSGFYNTGFERETGNPTNEMTIAFLGLQDPGSNVQIIPDYQLPYSKMVASITRTIISHSRDLSIFEVLTYRAYTPACMKPSWVPFFHEYHGVPRHFVGFEATQGRRHRDQDLPADFVRTILRTRGMIIDCIRILALPYRYNALEHSGFDLKLDIMARRLGIDLQDDPAMAEWRLFRVAIAEGSTRYTSVAILPKPVPDETKKRGIDRVLWETYRSQEWDSLNGEDLLSHMDTCHDRRLALTSGKKVGLVPVQSEVEDVICILHGSNVPVVLRQHKDGETYEVVGQCYLEGVMYGEAVTWDEEEADTFLLR
jgi:hypothetical protein